MVDNETAEYINMMDELNRYKEQCKRYERAIRENVDFFGGELRGEGYEISDLNALLDKMQSLNLPEGHEWPRFEDGEQVKFGDCAVGWDGKTFTVDSAKIYEDGHVFIYGYTSDGECAHADNAALLRFKRPPVLAADGKPIEVGQTVYSRDGLEQTIKRIAYGKNGTVLWVECDSESGPWNRVPSELTHERHDSWEKLESDATAKADELAAADICVPDYASYRRAMTDILRRAKALAGVE